MMKLVSNLPRKPSPPEPREGYVYELGGRYVVLTRITPPPLVPCNPPSMIGLMSQQSCPIWDSFCELLEFSIEGILRGTKGGDLSIFKGKRPIGRVLDLERLRLPVEVVPLDES